MGSSNCANSVASQSKQDIIAREMKLYRCRADSNDSCLPKIQFNNQSHMREEDKLKEFISKYREKDYLDLYKLRKELQNQQSNDQEIVIFQRYACGLKDFKFSLFLEEVVYSILTLLTAYQQIKKIYTGDIPVTKECCFVTLKGEVRGWINSNPKSNQIQRQSEFKIFGEREYRAIVSEIICIGEELAIKDMRIQAFAVSLKSFIRNIVVRADIFEKTRNFIRGYCRTAGFEVVSNLGAALRRSRDLPILKFSRKCLHKEESFDRRPNSSYHSPRNNSQISGNCRSQINQDQVEKRSRSGMNTTLNSFIGLNQSLMPNDSSFGAPIQYRKEALSFRRFSELQAPQTSRTEQAKSMFKASQVLPSTPKPRVNADIQWIVQKKVQTSINDNIVDEKLSIPSTPSKHAVQYRPNLSVKFENIKKSNQKIPSNSDFIQDEEGTLLESNFLTSKELTNMNISKARRDYKYKTANMEKKPSRQISILDIEIEEASENKENLAKRVHFHTYQEVKTSQTSIEPPERPWLTNKTISQLLSNKEEADSLVHSMGSSSQDRAASSYSGALSGMGRNVSMPKKTKPFLAQAH